VEFTESWEIDSAQDVLLHLISKLSSREFSAAEASTPLSLYCSQGAQDSRLRLYIARQGAIHCYVGAHPAGNITQPRG